MIVALLFAFRSAKAATFAERKAALVSAPILSDLGGKLAADRSMPDKYHLNRLSRQAFPSLDLPQQPVVLVAF